MLLINLMSKDLCKLFLTNSFKILKIDIAQLRLRLLIKQNKNVSLYVKVLIKWKYISFFLYI